jgi:SAM-dependent methyltransferase
VGQGGAQRGSLGPLTSPRRLIPPAPKGNRAACPNALTGLIALLVFLSGSVAAQEDPTPPSVGTPPRVIDRMLSLAKLRSTDSLIDLGSGDGRIVLEAARRGAHAQGIEVRADLVTASRREAERLRLTQRAEFRQADIFAVDLSGASVLTLYLSPEFNERLVPRILATMRPGARIVSHDFPLGTWRPDAIERFDVPEKNYGRGGESVVMLWIVPASAAGRWRASIGEGSLKQEFVFSIAQQFQAIEGALLSDRGYRRFARAALHADNLSMTIDGAPSPYGEGSVTARIEGDRMTGIFRFRTTEAVGAVFRAQRVDTRPDLFD